MIETLIPMFLSGDSFWLDLIYVLTALAIVVGLIALAIWLAGAAIGLVICAFVYLLPFDL